MRTVADPGNLPLWPNWTRSKSPQGTPVHVFHAATGQLIATFRGRSRVAIAKGFCSELNKLGDWSTIPPSGPDMTQVCELVRNFRALGRVR
jgi:hypothetical protein